MDSEEGSTKAFNHTQWQEIHHNQQKRIWHEESKAQTLTIGFIFVQTIILMSLVNNKSSDRCEQWWMPFLLSLSVGFIYFLTIIEVVKRCYRLLYDLDVSYMEREHMWAEAMGGAPFLQTREELKPDAVKLLQRMAYNTILISAMLAFQTVMLYACNSFLCN